MQPQEDITTDQLEKEYQLVRLNKNNLVDLARLHNEVYNTSRSPDVFIKKYNTAYTGVENVGFLAYKNDRPIAFYGVIPCFIKYGDEVMIAAQSADTMTHPDFRYKGMFVELSNMCFGLCKELGIRLVFGFPNQNSYHGAVTKLGWKETETMECFTIPVKTFPLQTAFKKIGLLKTYHGYVEKALNQFDAGLKGSTNSVFADGFAGVYRSDEYLDYKTYSKTMVLEIEGARIWCKVKSTMIIGDIELPSHQNFESVMNNLTRLCKKLGIGQVQFHCCHDTTLHRLFAEKFPATKSFPVLFQDFGSPIPPGKIKFTFADIDIF